LISNDEIDPEPVLPCAALFEEHSTRTATAFRLYDKMFEYVAIIQTIAVCLFEMIDAR
jgi:hypothetical protein